MNDFDILTKIALYDTPQQLEFYGYCLKANQLVLLNNKADSQKSAFYILNVKLLKKMSIKNIFLLG